MKFDHKSFEIGLKSKQKQSDDYFICIYRYIEYQTSFSLYLHNTDQFSLFKFLLL